MTGIGSIDAAANWSRLQHVSLTGLQAVVEDKTDHWHAGSKRPVGHLPCARRELPRTRVTILKESQ